VSDDTAGIIWRVIAPGASPSAAPKAVVATRMPPAKNLIDPTKPMTGEFGPTVQTTMPAK
jgi:hypothetical protein